MRSSSDPLGNKQLSRALTHETDRIRQKMSHLSDDERSKLWNILYDLKQLHRRPRACAECERKSDK